MSVQNDRSQKCSCVLTESIKINGKLSIYILHLFNLSRLCKVPLFPSPIHTYTVLFYYIFLHTITLLYLIQTLISILVVVGVYSVLLKDTLAHCRSWGLNPQSSNWKTTSLG